MDIKFEKPETSSLWLPDYFKKEEVDILGKVAKMLISHEDLYKTNFALTDLKTSLSPLPKDGVLIACSILASALSVRGGSNINSQRELAAQFFPEEKLSRINELFDEERILFFEHQLIALAKTAMVWCQSKNTNLTQDQIRKFAGCLLGINGLLHRDYGGKKLESTKGQVSFFFNTFDLNFPTWNAFGTQLGRLEQLWNTDSGLVYKYAENMGLDLKREFILATGHLTIDDFIAISFALVAHYLRFINPRSDWPKPNVMLSQMFKKVSPESIQDYENLMCVENISQLGKPNDAFFFTDFSVFRKKPFIRLHDGSVIPVSLNLLCSKISESIYWILHQRFSGNQSLINPFTAAFGHAFEEYTRGLIYWARPIICQDLPTAHFDVPYLKGQKKSTDIILEYPESLIFLEVTSSRPRLASKSQGDISEIEAYVKDVILPKARNIKNSIQDFRNGLMDLQLRPFSHGQRIFPVIVLYPDIPLVPPVWELIDEIFKKNGMKLDEPLTILSAEELELITAMIHHGFSLEQLIIEMHKSLLYRQLNIRSFLLDRLGDKKLINDYVYNSFETRAKSVLTRFFPERKKDISALNYSQQ